METEHKVLNFYKTKQYDECLKACDAAAREGENRMIEFIRMRVQTIQAKIAGQGYEEVGYGSQNDEKLISTAVAKTPRPGTSFQKSNVKSSSAFFTPRATTTARRQTGASAGRARSSLHSAARASRAATAVAGGASFTPGAPITLTFATKQTKLFTAASKTMFEYVLYCEGDVRKALEFALEAQKTDLNSDWWWDYAAAKCYLMLAMHRAAEESLRKALKNHKHVAIFLRLVALFVDINQPITALEICKQGLSVFPEDTALLVEQARIHDEMGSSSLSVQDYRRVALEDPTNMEATANIAMYNFYNDQPEIALRYYRRLLATCPTGPEIYNNLGLCCLYCNQWDLTLPCFRQALYFSTNPKIRSEIWFNIAHVALSTGDLTLARRCLQLSLALSSDHIAARSALRAIDDHIRNAKGYN